jgi:hypothetical protein
MSGAPAMGDALAAGERRRAKEGEHLFFVISIPLCRWTVELGAEFERRHRSIGKPVLDRELPECGEARRILSVESGLAHALELDCLSIALAHPPVLPCRRPTEEERALVLRKAFRERNFGDFPGDGQEVIAVDVQHDRITEQADTVAAANIGVTSHLQDRVQYGGHRSRRRHG